jgi:hypothetical protein
MAEPLLLLAGAAIANLAGFAWLALAMDVHWAQVHGLRARATPARLRMAGGAALALSFGLCLGADHPSMAVLVWFMLLAGSAVAIAMTLSTRPRWLRWLWPASSRR